MNAKQNHPGTSETAWPLQCELPKILVESQDQSIVCFCALDQSSVLQSGTVRPGPENIVTLFSQSLDSRAREVLIGQKSHQAGIG
jgi:hypothetical protein